MSANQSNGSLYDIDCSSLTGWSDLDGGSGVSTQATFDGESTFKSDTGANTSSYTYRKHASIGDITGLGNRVVVTLRWYHDALGSKANGDQVLIDLRATNWRLIVYWATDGLFIHNGTDLYEVGTNLVIEDGWQEWTFDCDVTTSGSETCDVYLNGVLQSSGFDCSRVQSGTNGQVGLIVYGAVDTDRISYLDLFKVGDGFAATGTNTQINIGDVWKTIDAMKINIGDVWKDVEGMQINIGDAWKTIF